MREAAGKVPKMTVAVLKTGLEAPNLGAAYFIKVSGSETRHGYPGRPTAAQCPGIGKGGAGHSNLPALPKTHIAQPVFS